ncbi:MAG TPA: dethiobiotin synthase [Polyangiaceae bacterium]
MTAVASPARRLVLVTGTGTGIGKTHLAEALLLALPRDARVVGLKPVESGVEEGALSDADRLARASTFHVQHFRIALRTPVAPTLAARREGVAIDAGRLQNEVARVRDLADVTVVELPGGLFSPFVDRTLNLDFGAALRPDATLLVAPDRLGVIHDVMATWLATRARGFDLHALALVAPEQPDASSGTNAEEIAPLVPDLPLVTVPRGSPDALALGAELRRLVTALVRLPAAGDPARATAPGRPAPR